MRIKKFISTKLMLAIFLTVITFGGSGILTAQKKFALKKKTIRQTLKIRDKYITGIIYEDGVNSGMPRKYFGMFTDNCKRVYIGISDQIAAGLHFRHFTKVRVRVSAGSYLNINKAVSSRKNIPAKQVTIIRRHDFVGRVSVINCNDNYFEINYKLCTYSTSSVKVGISRNECIRLNLQIGMRVKVTANGWTYSPRKELYTISNVVRIVKQ